MSELKVHNRTTESLSDIRNLEQLLVVRSNWRQRMITLYAVPCSDDVYSVGESFDGKKMVICRESKEDWARELSQGKPYVVTD